MGLNQSRKGPPMEDLFRLLEQLAERNQADTQFTPEKVEEILKDPNASLRLAVASAAGAQNRIASNGGDPSGSEVADASLCQRQAALWLGIHERQLEVEDREESKRSHAEFLKQQVERERFPKPTYGTRISDAFSQGTRPGSAKVPPFAREPEPDVPDASSGSEDKPLG